MEKAPALPTMEDLRQRDPETLQPGVWERAKDLAEIAKYHLYNLVASGQGYRQTEFQSANRQRLLNLQEKLKGHKKVIGAAGAIAAGMASVLVASPATAANLTTVGSKVAGGVEGFDLPAIDLTDSDTFTDGLDTIQDIGLGDDENTTSEESPKPMLAPTEEPKADIVDQLASQAGLEQDESGEYHTQGMDEYGATKEDELYKSGTAYNEVEKLMRGMGYTTEDIQKLDESGEYHDIVRQFLHENNITYADEASGHPDMMLDTEVPSGHKFDVSQEFLARIHDTNPPEVNTEQLIPQGLDEAQKDALDNTVGAMSDEEIAALYDGIDIGELPPASEVDSLSDLPVPETAEDRLKLEENLGALTEKTKETPAEFIGREKSFWNSDWNEEAIVIGAGALLAAGAVAGGALYDKKKNRRRSRQQPQLPPLSPELQAELERREDIRQQRWWDQNPQPGMAAAPAPAPNTGPQPPTLMPQPTQAPAPVASPLEADDFNAVKSESGKEPTTFDDHLAGAIIERIFADSKKNMDYPDIDQMEADFKQYLLDNSDKTFNRLYAQHEVGLAGSASEYAENYEDAKNRFKDYLSKNNDLYIPYPPEDGSDEDEFQEELEKLLDEFLKNKAQADSDEDQPARRV